MHLLLVAMASNLRAKASGRIESSHGLSLTNEVTCVVRIRLRHSEEKSI